MGGKKNGLFKIMKAGSKNTLSFRSANTSNLYSAKSELQERKIL